MQSGEDRPVLSGKSKKGKPFAQSVGEGGNAVKRSWGRTGLGFDFQFRSPSIFDFTNVTDRKYTSLAALSERNLLKNRKKTLLTRGERVGDERRRLLLVHDHGLLGG